MSPFKIQCRHCREVYSLPDSWKNSLANKQLICDACERPWVPFPAPARQASAAKPLGLDLSVYRAQQSGYLSGSAGTDSPPPSPRTSTQTTQQVPMPPAFEPSLRVLAKGPGVDVRAVYSLTGRSFLIGQTGCHINLPTESIPQQAVRIRWHSDAFTFEGLGGFRPQVGTGPAAKGTIAPGQRVQMKIGSSALLFEVTATPGSPIADLDTAPESSSAVQPPPVPPSPAIPQPTRAPAPPTAPPRAPAEPDDLDGTVLDLAADGVARASRFNPLQGIEAGFVFVEGQHKGKGYRITKNPTLIGRSTGDVQIPDGRVSRKHAQLDILGPAEYSLKDLASTNGTSVNDRTISTTRIENGDVVSFGGIKLKFVTRPIRKK